MNIEDWVPHAIEWAPQGLRLHWSDGEALIDAMRLRAACRCAACRSALLQGRLEQPPPGVNLTAAEPVGRYALNLHFSDGHARGVYPWSVLRELATD